MVYLMSLQWRLGPVAGVGGGLGPGKQQPWQPQHTTLTLTTLVHADVEGRPQSGALGEGVEAQCQMETFDIQNQFVTSFLLNGLSLPKVSCRSGYKHLFVPLFNLFILR